jgi:hypothetical protein
MTLATEAETDKRMGFDRHRPEPGKLLHRRSGFSLTDPTG